MESNHFIVAIGASAGGLEALTTFFEHTPLDNVSYIVIPHLSPDFKSRMVGILSRHSRLEVLEAEDNMEVKTDKVYLIPNTKYMGIKEGRLVMFNKEGRIKPHMTIDSFFTSLAKEKGSKAIGVILSGLGNDGSRGAIDIENAGGVVMIQDPSDAKFDGMPKSTLAVSNTGYVLPVHALPMAIQKYVHQNPYVNISKEKPLSEKFLSDLIGVIKQHFPFDFTNYKLPTLLRRIRKKMLHLKITDEDEFIYHLAKNPDEIELLISDFLIGVTSFFRDSEAFNILENEVIPQIFERKSGNDFIKLWVACCATGEEAYSLAILVREFLIRNEKEIDVKIFATDINRTALKQAAKGVFSENIAETVSAERLQNFFDKGEDNYKIKPEIRKMLIFARHDLTKNPPYVDADLISCRNMLIYIKPVLQREVLAKLAFGLKQKGFLFLGSSENLSISKEDFSEISPKWKIYQSIVARRRVTIDNSITALLSDFPLKYMEAVKPKVSVSEPALLPDMTQVILSESGYSGVSIDHEGIVMQSYGDLSPYLKPQWFTSNLQELLPETLAIAFSASLNKVLKQNQRIRVNNIKFKQPDSKSGTTDLIISPFSDKKSNTLGMLVLFRRVNESQTTVQEGIDFNIDKQTKDHIFQLQDELERTKKDLLHSTENLENSKEAMQAYNEELLSANEEMQSANEELQSINEELETFNTQHQYNINELSNLNDDLNNYFNSNINGQLFVDRDILLKKYSPGAIKHINIRDSDIGRPLSNITTNIKFETLIGDIKKVLANGEIIIQEVESNEGKIYQVMTSPYLRKSDRTIYGAIITFYDISELKRTQNELNSTNKMLSLATIAAEMATWSIDVNTREFTSSLRLREIFGIPDGEKMAIDTLVEKIEAEHKSLFLNAINDAIVSGEKLDLEFQIKGLQHDLRWVKAIGNLTNDSEGKVVFLTGIMHDVTSHKLDDLRKNDFISIVSHELKTPLTTLKGYLQIMQTRAEKSKDTFSATALTKSNKQVKKMTDLINGFLNVSRLDAGKIYLNKEVFKIDDLIKEIIEEILATTSGYNIIQQPGCESSVNADRDKIGQVVNNLISNAIKYSPRDRDIEVTCVEISNTVQISIKDHGIGVKLEDQEKLFERFHRVVDENTNTVSGFGIGLYLSSEIIKHHNGKIWVESEIGKGSTFYFSLPLTQKKINVSDIDR